MLLEFDVLTFPALYAALVLLCVAITLIDIRQGIIPDRLNVSVAALGLLNVWTTFGIAAGAEAIAEAIATGVVLLLLRQIYFVWRNAKIPFKGVFLLFGAMPSQAEIDADFALAQQTITANYVGAVSILSRL